MGAASVNRIFRVAGAALSLMVAASGVGAAAPAADTRIPVEAFGELPFLSSPSISPDGRRVVAGSVIDGKKAVVLADVGVADYALRRLALPDTVEVLSTAWAGNERVLISLLISAKALGIEFKSSRLALYDLAAGKLKWIEDKVGGLDGDNVLFVDPAGNYLLLAAQRNLFEAPSVLRIDLDTMKASRIVEGQDGVWSWHIDAKGVVRAGLGRSGGRWWLLYRETEGAPFRKIAKGGSNDPAKMTELEALFPAAGTDKGYVIANKTTGRYGVYRYDFATDSVGEPLFEHPEVDVDGVSFSPRTYDVDAVTYVDDRERIVWFDPKMKALQARIDKALPNAINRVVSRDSSDRLMIVKSSAASNPGSYYIFNSAKGELREFVRPHAKLDGAPLRPVEPVRYAARDGLSIPAYLTMPAGGAGKMLPLIVMPHGGPFHRDKWEYDPWVQFLANRGYVVLQPNFRGSTGYGKEYVDRASGEFGRKMQDDLDDGVRWLAGQGLIDPKRVCIMGASYGGYAALWGAARNPEIYRCAISFAGISDVQSMLRYDRSRFAATRYTKDWRERIRGEGGLGEVAPLKRVADIRVPILLAHGTDDRVVPQSQSIRFHDAMQAAGKPHEYVLYKGEGHGFQKVENSIDFLERVEAFLKKHNPAG
jgi:dipeptidyl aminopeptidase/acylaminoacyl peptidase